MRIQPKQFARTNKIVTANKEPEMIYCDKRKFRFLISNIGEIVSLFECEPRSEEIDIYWILFGQRVKVTTTKKRKTISFYAPETKCVHSVCVRANEGERMRACTQCVSCLCEPKWCFICLCAFANEIKIEVVDAAQKGSRKWYSFFRIWAHKRHFDSGISMIAEEERERDREMDSFIQPSQ